jgi:hypothetical protein
MNVRYSQAPHPMPIHDNDRGPAHQIISRLGVGPVPR